MIWPFARKGKLGDRSSPIVFQGRLTKWAAKQPDIEYLVIAADDFIVYVDRDIDVEWETADDIPDEDDHTDKSAFKDILNRVAALEATPCDEIPRRMKVQFKRLVGEGVARALDGDFDGAKSILKSAGEYIKARSQETSRFWYLSASSLMSLPFIVFGATFWLLRGPLIAGLGNGAFWVIVSGCAGALGASLSVIGRTGKLHFDSSAGRRLHYLEASSRIWAGAISGVLVGLAVHAQLFLTAITRNGYMPEIMILAALASGASERFATSIIADLSGSATRKKEGHDS